MASPRKKPRGDSKLKTLSPEKQERVIEWLNTCTQAQVVRKVKAVFEIKTSKSALSEFYSWFYLGRSLEKAAEFGTHLKEQLSSIQGLDLDEDQINRAAQVVFEMKAAEKQDPALFLALRNMRLKERTAKSRAQFKERELELRERQISLLEKKAAQADEASKVADSNLSPHEKEQRFKEIFGLG